MLLRWWLVIFFSRQRNLGVEQLLCPGNRSQLDQGEGWIYLGCDLTERDAVSPGGGDLGGREKQDACV